MSKLMIGSSLRVWHLYVGVVLAAGGAVLVHALSSADRSVFTSTAYWALAGLILLAELAPIRFRRRGVVELLVLSNCFAFALLLFAGPGAAVLAMAGSSVVADILTRTRWYRIMFNGAQYVLTIGAAGWVLQSLGYSRLVLAAPSIDLAQLWPIVPAGAALFLVNHVLVGIAVGLYENKRMFPLVAHNFGFEALANGVLLLLAPVVVVVAHKSVLLMVLLLIPVAAIYRGAQASAEKEHQAQHDALTGLANRALFRDTIDWTIEEHETKGHPAVLLLDLDNFKEINDALGHQIGDRLLEQVGERIKDVADEGATVARLGGDEFGVLLPAVKGTPSVIRTAIRVIEAIQRPFQVEGLSLHVDSSVGIALHPDHGEDADELIQHADVAMYEAKDGGLGMQVYDPDSDRNTRRRLALANDLRTAISDGQLLLHYHPKASAKTGTITGVEALVRWQHPRLGLIPPDEFIPLAERTDLIRPLAAQVLDMAVEQCALWRRAGFNLSVAINLSMRNLYDEQLRNLVAHTLRRHELPAKALEVEVTESSIMEHPERTTKILDELGRMGIRIAIDDFGTGYSSLAQLKRLPVHEIKIDKSFVLNLQRDSSDAVIVRSAVDMGRNLGMTVVAEGVETAESWTLLAELDCDFVQGFYLTEPLGPQEMTLWLFDRLPDGSAVRKAQHPLPGDATPRQVVGGAKVVFLPPRDG